MIRGGFVMQVNKKLMLEELENGSEMLLSTAYLYAKTFTEYGEDITKVWDTAVRQTHVLENAYRKGYYDAMNAKIDNVKLDKIRATVHSGSYSMHGKLNRISEILDS